MQVGCLGGIIIFFFFAFYLVGFLVGWLRFFSFSCFHNSAQKRTQEGRNGEGDRQQKRDMCH